MLKMIDPSVEPCHDFYQFSCGGFLNSTKETDGLSQILEYQKLDDEFLENLRQILEQESAIDDFKYLKLAKTLYKACDKFNSSEFYNSLKSSGDWPVLKGKKWNESAFDFNKTIFNVGNTSQWKNYFFKFHLFPENSYIEMTPYPSAFSLEEFIEGRNNTRFVKYFNEISVFISKMRDPYYDNKEKNEDIEKMIAFEIELGRSRLSKEQELNSSFDAVEMTLNDLNKNYSFFNWQEYINYHRDSPVNSSTIIIIQNISYLKKLQHLLNSEETKTIANYIMWTHIYSNSKSALSAFDCTKFIFDKLPIAVGAIYVQYHNRSELTSAHNNLLKISLNIKDKFIELIKEADWMDDETKNKSTEKLELSHINIGYLNEFTNNSKVDEFFKNLELFDGENVYDSIGRIELFERKYMLTYNNKNTWPIMGSFKIESSLAFWPPYNSIGIFFFYIVQ